MLPEQINGDYKLTIKVEDPRAINSYQIELGKFQVNFNDGTSDGDNLGLRSDYKLLDIITNYFPPEEADKSPIIPLIFSVVIGSLFFYFVTQLFANGANMSNLTFWGLLFSVNYMVVIGVIIAFWI